VGADRGGGDVTEQLDSRRWDAVYQDRLLRDASWVDTDRISKYVVQIVGAVSGRWLDSAYSPSDTVEEARENAAGYAESAFGDQLRIVRRTISITEEVLDG
jgi:hypothetical protein